MHFNTLGPIGGSAPWFRYAVTTASIINRPQSRNLSFISELAVDTKELRPRHSRKWEYAHVMIWGRFHEPSDLLAVSVTVSKFENHGRDGVLVGALSCMSDR